ncbi:MAG: UDP-N-acetylglucosamine 2-epimerase (non-hydrolyzing) [Alphaproteobacteria bacterium]|nr:MAG: UDP-N-acetylglucosamine 2-epimerase (non-hydrolyzing) [Alphaproteobacteria bacterium]
MTHKPKILSVFGTRPEAIKMAPIVGRLKFCDEFESRVCVTAQHREMLDQVLTLFEIKPHFDLNLMRPGQALNELTASAIEQVGKVLTDYRPDILLVNGDTNTTMAATLAAYHLKIPVGHVEAGLRTGDIYSPWPEEINRKIVGTIATMHFAPTERAKANLIAENVSPNAIFVTGNTVVDSLLDTVRILNERVALSEEINSKFSFLSEKKIILVTGHRRESFGDGFNNICEALSIISKRGDVQIVYPVHPNPNIRDFVYKKLSGRKNIHLIDPLDYLPFIELMRRSYLIMTDSGGIQEEAPSLGKPVLVMRSVTERPEAIAAGTVKLVGTNADILISEVEKLLDCEEIYTKMSKAHNPYGDGKSAERIVAAVRTHLLNRESNNS